jgi:glycosyltransferase involved in cell wall biosynthesis
LQREIWFWQAIVCPLWAGLAASVAATGAKVVFAAAEPLSEARRALGWSVPDTGLAEVRILPDRQAMEAAAAAAPLHAVHVCMGVRSNGNIVHAQAVMRARGARQLILFETVDEDGWKGPLKKYAYSALLARLMPSLGGVLAIGDTTPEWLAARGVPADKLFPFAYFLSDKEQLPVAELPPRTRYRFLFVGQFVERKRLDLLIRALAELDDPLTELEVIGSGEDGEKLRELGETLLGDRLIWTGLVPRPQIPTHVAAADCMVLPSRHDGWGAVVCEAVMAGVPAIASDRCGTRGVVRGSGVGGVFPSGDGEELARLLARMARQGRLDLPARQRLQRWSASVGSQAGAAYLSEIVAHVWEGADRPVVPWLRGGDQGRLAA